MADTTKHGRIKLIRDFFAPVTMQEMKDLTEQDKAQLASGIAREKGLKPEELDFEPVAY